MLVARGVIQPTPITRKYRVKLAYEERHAPKVFVISPRLERRPSQPELPIPHTYGSSKVGEERPCLYLPESGEWTPSHAIAITIMPWFLTWLVDYEIWLATGEWLGGGAPHGSSDGDCAPSSRKGAA